MHELTSRGYYKLDPHCFVANKMNDTCVKKVAENSKTALNYCVSIVSFYFICVQSECTCLLSDFTLTFPRAFPTPIFNLINKIMTKTRICTQNRFFTVIGGNVRNKKSTGTSAHATWNLTMVSGQWHNGTHQNRHRLAENYCIWVHDMHFQATSFDAFAWSFQPSMFVRPRVRVFHTANSLTYFHTRMTFISLLLPSYVTNDAKSPTVSILFSTRGHAFAAVVHLVAIVF